ncbi:hypothetical protein [Variovorax paradoxus]|uniref:Uncharacterized protein n=1 Tax=Variovorax paradoxus TaxID=34073 RepID=A0A679IYT3_VARPD|nr:hypothetical protein VVAX_03574 [Variovorax paradoxus]
MRAAFVEICIGAAVVLVGLHLTFMTFAAGRYGAAACALFGVLLGVLLIVAGDREWQESLDRQDKQQVEG